MNYQEVHDKAINWMNARGWREAYGKKGAFTQSLLQHTDIELNVLLSLLPIFARQEHYALTEAEQQALIVGQIAHDVGKETERWQVYVRAPREEQRGNYVPHVIRPLTDDTVTDLVSALGFPSLVIPDATKFVNLHMAATRNPTNVLNAALFQKGLSGRWNTLARIVDTIDNICSIRALLPTLQAIENDQRGGVIGPHIQLAYHQIHVRGVSSVMLHKAAEQAYAAEGWQPILYFSDGTIYIADGLTQIAESSRKDIFQRLSNVLTEIVDKDYSSLIISSNFSKTVIPKPDLFNLKHLRRYLRVASTRLRTASFEGAHYPKRKATAEEIAAMADGNRELTFKYLSEKAKMKNPEAAIPELTQADIEKFIARQAEQQPDIAIWIFFRAALKLGLLGDIQQRFNDVFGAGSYERFEKCPSQRQFVRNMIYGSEIFGEMTQASFDLGNDQKVELLPVGQRIDLLIDTLAKVVDASNQDTTSAQADIASAFNDDLLHPYHSEKEWLTLAASEQLNSYSESRKSAYSKASKPRLCPICNSQFRDGVVAKQDFVDSPEAHTNRAISHGTTGSIVICNACKYERFLQQLLLGERVNRVLAVAPRNHIGRWTGEAFVNQVEAFGEEATNLMSNSTRNPNERISLSLTFMIAKKVLAHSAGENMVDHVVRTGLTGAELSELLSYSLSDDKKKEYRKALQKAIREEFELTEDESIESANAALDVSYADWDALLDDIVSGDFGRKHPSEVMDDIRAQTQKLQPQLRVICQTPNFALVPLRYGFGGDKDSDTNAALRELFVLLLIGLALDCSVASIDSGETITFSGGEGVARVPPVPAIRDLIGSEWVSLESARKWLEKIGAAGLLAGDTAFPERSNLYQVLSALTPGHILRRVEMQSDSGQARLSHIELIQQATQPV